MQFQLAKPLIPSICGNATPTYCGERSQSVRGIPDSGTVLLDGETAPDSIFARVLRTSKFTCSPVVPDNLKAPMIFVNCLSEGTADCAWAPNIPRACAALSRTQASESFRASISTGTHSSGWARISPSAHNAFARTLRSELVADRKSNRIAGFAAGPIQANASSIALRESADRSSSYIFTNAGTAPLAISPNTINALDASTFLSAAVTKCIFTIRCFRAKETTKSFNLESFSLIMCKRTGMQFVPK
jgi:hypothetical protein